LGHPGALRVRRGAVGALGGIEQPAARHVVVRVVAVTLEQVLYMRQTRYRRNLDPLLETEFLGGHRAIHPIGQPVVPLFLGLDDRRRMDPRTGPERVGPDHRVVDGDRNTDRVRHQPTRLGQFANVARVGAKELEIYYQQIHFGIANALTDAEGGGMDAVDASFDGGKAVAEAHAAIAMAVPVDLHVFALDDFLLDEFHQCRYAVGSCVPHRVGEADAGRAAFDCRTVQRLDGLGPRAGRILGDVHDGETVVDRVRDGLFSRIDDAVDGPVLGVLPDGGGADERRRLDRNADFLRDPYDRLDIGDDRARGAIRCDRQSLVADLLGQRANLLHRTRSGTRQPDVGRHDAELGHQMQKPLFDLERWVLDGRRLETVA